jgi:hypothetical protein
MGHTVAMRAFGALLEQRLLTAHMSIGNKTNALECLREDLSCGTISTGSLKIAGLLGPKSYT